VYICQFISLIHCHCCCVCAYCAVLLFSCFGYKLNKHLYYILLGDRCICMSATCPVLEYKSGMSGSKLPHPSIVESTVSLPFVPTKLYCLATTKAPACELLAFGRRMKKSVVYSNYVTSSTLRQYHCPLTTTKLYCLVTEAFAQWQHREVESRGFETCHLLHNYSVSLHFDHY